MYYKILTAIFLFFLFIPFSDSYGKCSNYLEVASLFKDNLEYEKAISVIEKIDKPILSLKIYLAYLYYLNGNEKKALKLLKTIKHRDGKFYLYLALVEEALGKDREALENYRRAFSRYKNSISLYRSGKIYYKNKNYRYAEKLFRQTLQYDRSIKLTYYYLGMSLFYQKKYKEAHFYLSRARESYPQIFKLKEIISFIREKLGKDFFLKERIKKQQRRKRVILIPYKVKGRPLVSVNILKSIKGFSFRGKDFFVQGEGKKKFFPKDKVYYLKIKNNSLHLDDEDFGKILNIYPARSQKAYSFYFLDAYSNKEASSLERHYRGGFKVFLDKDTLEVVNILNIEEYLKGVVPAEISPSSNFEALKAQSIIARTFAYYAKKKPRHKHYDLCATTHCQVYYGLSYRDKNTSRAVEKTQGEVLVYKNKLLETFYHANSGGCLRRDTFDEPYFKNVLDNKKKERAEFLSFKRDWFLLSSAGDFFSSFSSNFRWQRVYDGQDYRLIYGRKLERLEKISPLKSGDCWHWQKALIKEKDTSRIIEGSLNIRKYFDNLKSSSFIIDIKLNSSHQPSLLIIWGAGYGHGRGLSQDGASYMAEKGFSYKDILNHYYPGTHTTIISHLRGAKRLIK